MSTARQLQAMGFAEYLATEEASPVKREWVNGQAWAMAGGTLLHGTLQAAIMGAFRDSLKGRPCRAVGSDVRVRVPETGLATYPDVTVACGPLVRDAEDTEAIADATVIVEVLSPSTEDWDRGGKWRHYRHIPSLRHYVLFAQDEDRVELNTRLPDGTWNLSDLSPGQKAELSAIGVILDIAAIYAEARAAAR